MKRRIHMKRKANRTFGILFFATLLCYFGMAEGTDLLAQDVIKLKYATGYIAAESPSLIASYWCDLVEKKTQGRVKIERHFGGTVGSIQEMLPLCSSGTVDLVTVIPQFYRERLPLHTWLNDEMWRKADDARIGANALEFEIPETASILEREAVESGIKFIMWNSAGGYGTMFRSRATKLADMAGKKIRSIASMGYVVKEFGGVPVSVNLGETYEGMSRGVIDGVMCVLSAAAALKLHEPSQSYIDSGRDAGSAPLAINLAKWKSLPSFVQEAMLSATKESLRYNKELDDEFVNKFMATMSAKKMTITRFRELPVEEQEKMDATWGRILGVDWLSQMDKKGLGKEANVLYKHYEQLFNKFGKQ
jgi:TRAP-type C4-dicarboxylate transport system substrate-binding protein